MSWEASSLIVCDDIRVEVNGKQILIGVYSGDIVFPSFPASMYQLVFRVEVLAAGKRYKKIAFRIKKANQEHLMNMASDAPQVDDPNENSVYMFTLAQPLFSGPEKYTVEFGLDDELAAIGSFRVRTPKNPGESGKVISENKA